MAKTELQRIPGVGPSIEGDLLAIGVRRIDDLVGRDPQDLYERVCARQGLQVDRCLLYVMRCAVYYAEHPDPDPELLKWWVWKGRPHPREKAPK
jgi:hypothetical protein